MPRHVVVHIRHQIFFVQHCNLGGFHVTLLLRNPRCFNLCRFQLLVIPHVIPGTNNMTLEVIPKETSLSGTGQSALAPAGFDVFTVGASGLEGSIALPRTRSSTIVTSMLLESGESAVIGGLTTDTDTRSDSRVPYISAIPVIGELFKYKKHERARRSLLVFITPQIMHGSADTEEVVQRELARRKTKLKDQIEQMIDPNFGAAPGAPTTPTSGGSD